MLSNSRPRVALCGCGRWGRHILRDLVALGCDVSVVDVSGEKRALALAYGAVSVATAVAELRELDAAIVATPTRTHEDVIAELLPLAIPIFCEKPLTADVRAAARLAAEAPDGLFVMDKWRYHPGVEMLGQIARSEELGPVEGLRTFRRGRTDAQDVDPIWVIAPQDLGIGLEVLGILPEPQVVRASRCGDELRELSATLGADPWLEFRFSITREPAHRELELSCRDGVARLRGTYEDCIEVVRASQVLERRALSPEPPLRRELRACLDHLRGGPRPRSSAAEGARAVELVARLHALADGAAATEEARS